MLVAALTTSAQGNNTRMGGDDGDYQSLAERVAKIENKNDMFNVYFNYAASAQLKVRRQRQQEWQPVLRRQRSMQHGRQRRVPMAFDVK